MLYTLYTPYIHCLLYKLYTSYIQLGLHLVYSLFISKTKLNAGLVLRQRADILEANIIIFRLPKLACLRARAIRLINNLYTPYIPTCTPYIRLIYTLYTVIYTSYTPSIRLINTQYLPYIRLVSTLYLSFIKNWIIG